MIYTPVDKAAYAFDQRFRSLWFLGGMGFTWHRAAKWQREMAPQIPPAKVMRANALRSDMRTLVEAYGR